MDPEVIPLELDPTHGATPQPFPAELTDAQKELIASLLSRDPAIEARLVEIMVVEDVLERRVLTRTLTSTPAKNWVTDVVKVMSGLWQKVSRSGASPADSPDERYYLPKGSREADEAYKKRLRLTPFFSQTADILNDTMGALFTTPPEFIGDLADDDQVKAFWDNATIDGDCLTDVCGVVAQYIQRQGFMGIAVDRAPLPVDVTDRQTKREPITQAEKEQRGLGRPILALYDATQILKIATDKQGLAWVKVCEVTDEQADFNIPVLRQKTVRIFDRQSIRSWRITEKDGKDVAVQALLTVPHTEHKGRVPFVIAHAFTDDKNLLGIPCLIDPATADIAAVQCMSDAKWSIFMAGAPLPWRKLHQQRAKDADEGKLPWNTNPGAELILQTGDLRFEGEDAGCIQMDTSGIELMLRATDMFKQIGKEAAGKNSGDGLNIPVPTSGISRAWKFKTSEERKLFLLTRALYSAFTPVLRLVCEKFGYDPEQLQIKFCESFDIQNTEADLKGVKGVLKEAQKSNLPALHKAALKSLPEFLPRPPTDTELEEIFEEIDEADLPTLNSSTGTTGSGAGLGDPSSTGATTSGPGGLPGDTALQIKPKQSSIPAKKIVGMHDVDEDFKNKLADDMEENGYDPDYPVLSVQYENGTATLLDGHHRGHAAKSIGMKRIPAFVIKEADLRPLLDARFNGKMPEHLSDLDPYIIVNGKPYSQFREKNDHTNGAATGSTPARGKISRPFTSAPAGVTSGGNGTGRGVMSGRR